MNRYSGARTTKTERRSSGEYRVTGVACSVISFDDSLVYAQLRNASG